MLVIFIINSQMNDEIKKSFDLTRQAGILAAKTLDNLNKINN